ncbi:MAG: hypothetical protein DBX55_10430 [Verrucomicrobia bacterium]|nr:MAG: hypothetical protein DBX55_10430 [Verrucomicrobiota bacterium]
MPVAREPPKAALLAAEQGARRNCARHFLEGIFFEKLPRAKTAEVCGITASAIARKIRKYFKIPVSLKKRPRKICAAQKYCAAVNPHKAADKLPHCATLKFPPKNRRLCSKSDAKRRVAKFSFGK